MIGIYIHVPFCIRKCPYCDFYSVSFTEELMQKYTDAVCRNISALKSKGLTADTVYFGGGTPSLLSIEQTEKILKCINSSVRLAAPEITMEANPSSADFEKLCGYKRAGVNRLSFGVQSLIDNELKALGRLHDAHRAQDAVISAYKAGFENISCDIMLGIPGQTEQTLDITSELMTALPIKHISAYMLKVEAGTPFDTAQMRALAEDDERMCALYLRLCETLAKKGFEHYEISNFALPGARSRHNLKYWKLQPYIGIGPAAHSDFEGKRTACKPELSEFLKSKVQKNVLIEENIDRAEELVMLSLRLSDGLSLGKLEKMKGEDFVNGMKKRALALEARGLLNIEETEKIGKITLTERGFLVSNAVIVYLLDC